MAGHFDTSIIPWKYIFDVKAPNFTGCLVCHTHKQHNKFDVSITGSLMLGTFSDCTDRPVCHKCKQHRTFDVRNIFISHRLSVCHKCNHRTFDVTITA